MILYDYMKKRNGVGRTGAVKWALSKEEFDLLGIDSSGGWTKRFRSYEVPEDLLGQLLSAAIRCKENNNKSTVRLMTNFESKDNKMVYLMFNKSNGLHKIGISVDPHTRMKQLNTGSGCALKMISIWIVEDYAKDVEKEIHIALKPYKKHGEWFDFSTVESVSLFVQSKISCEFKRI